MNGIEYELHVALYDRLKTSPLVMIPVYDQIPNGATYPYVSIDEITALPYRSKTFEGLEINALLSVLSDRGGQGTVKKHMAAVRAALAKPLQLREGHIVHQQEFSGSNIVEFTDEDVIYPSIKQGVLTFRFKIKEAERGQQE